MNDDFFAAFGQLLQILNSKKKTRFYPEHGNPRNHSMLAYGPGPWLVGPRGRINTAPGETRAAFARSLVPCSPSLHTSVDAHGRTADGSRPVSIIAHRLYNTDMVQMRYDGAVRTANYDSALSWKFLSSWCPRWARPIRLPASWLPREAHAIRGKSVRRVLAGCRWARVDVADLWLMRVGTNDAMPADNLSEQDLKARTTFKYSVRVLTKGAKRWRRENKARAMAVRSNAIALERTAIAAGMAPAAITALLQQEFRDVDVRTLQRMTRAAPSVALSCLMHDEVVDPPAYEFREKEFVL